MSGPHRSHRPVAGAAVELHDAVRFAIAPSEVWDALRDPALLRASIDHCEAFTMLAPEEYALTLTVPQGPLRARYAVRVHVAAEAAVTGGAEHRTLNFKAHAETVGSVRGQIIVRVLPDGVVHASSGPGDEAARLDYSVWAALAGPLTQLPPKQIDHALAELIGDFFAELRAGAEAKHGRGPNRARDTSPRRQRVFLRPLTLNGVGSRERASPDGQPKTRQARERLRAARRRSEPADGEDRARSYLPPGWAWAAMILVVTALLYLTHWLANR